MADSPEIQYRRSIRLKDYNYATEGAYFVTIGTHEKQCLFGDMIDDTMRLNDAGVMVREEWLRTPHRFPNIDLDEFVIMPNHLHGIIIVGATLAVARSSQSRAGTSPAPTKDNTYINYDKVRPKLGEIVGSFKSLSARKWIEYIENNNILDKAVKLWQRSFYDHIIRDENELYQIRKYIIENPLKWQLDKEYRNKKIGQNSETRADRIITKYGLWNPEQRLRAIVKLSIV